MPLAEGEDKKLPKESGVAGPSAGLVHRMVRKQWQGLAIHFKHLWGGHSLIGHLQPVLSGFSGEALNLWSILGAIHFRLVSSFFPSPLSLQPNYCIHSIPVISFPWLSNLK
jgi:hypothetical protein